MSMKISLVESNALPIQETIQETVPEFPIYLPVLLIVLASGSAAVFYLKKKTKKAESSRITP